MSTTNFLKFKEIANLFFKVSCAIPKRVFKNECPSGLEGWLSGQSAHTHIRIPAVVCVSKPVLGCQVAEIVHWLASLVKWMSSAFRKKPCLRKQNGEQWRKTFSSTAGLHMHAPTHIWTPTCSYTTHIYTQTCTYMGELLPLPEKWFFKSLISFLFYEYSTWTYVKCTTYVPGATRRGRQIPCT